MRADFDPTRSEADADLVARLRSEEGAEIFAAAEGLSHLSPLALGTRLRELGFAAELVAAAMTQVRLRARAVVDLGARASTMFFTDTGLQQATRWLVAQTHAGRFIDADVIGVADLGCGIGVDSLACAQAGLPVVAFERDPLTLAVAQANLAGFTASVQQADVTELFATGLSGGVKTDFGVFVDPARRSGSGARVFDPRSAQPPLSFIETMAGRVKALGAKVAPGVDHELVPEQAEAQWISVDGQLVEATFWFGTARQRQSRSALVLTGAGQSFTVQASDFQPVPGAVREFLVEADDAVIRAGVLGTVAHGLGATLLDPSIAYLSADTPAPIPAVARSYRVVDVLPFSLKGLRSHLRDRGVGVLTIKKRGTAVIPEQLRPQLKLKGDEQATIVLTRVAGKQSVLVVEPVSTSPR